MDLLSQPSQPTAHLEFSSSLPLSNALSSPLSATSDQTSFHYQRPFHFTFAQNYESFSPLDLHGVSCTIPEYFFLCNTQYELHNGTLKLREMSHMNQPTPEHNNSRFTCQAMAHSDLAKKKLVGKFLCYQEASYDPAMEGTFVLVADCLIVKPFDKSRLSEHDKRFDCPRGCRIEAAVEIVSPSSVNNDYIFKRKTHLQRRTKEMILVDHDKKNPRVTVLKLNSAEDDYDEHVYKGNEKVKESKFFNRRSANDMLHRTAKEAVESPEKRRLEDLRKKDKELSKKDKELSRKDDVIERQKEDLSKKDEELERLRALVQANIEGSSSTSARPRTRSRVRHSSNSITPNKKN